VFKKILIANRGEIAIRIIKSCRKMGIGTVAVYSEVDYRSRHVREADERVFIGGAPSSESYLNGKTIIAAALERECQAIHPGYGFLSENAAFAEMVSEAGLTFVGPSASAIAALGDKLESKALALRAGLPVCPGHPEAITDLDEALSIIETIGLPVLLKPAAGGGGRGMRVVMRRDELASAWAACREETRKAFADDRIFLERYISRPRHIEVQIVADNFGNVVHLGERECSIQRRYQKVVEETPSVAVDAELRDRLGWFACNLAREARYSNAGTVEFILDPDGAFYFLEMNTRLQVEHPVTEMVIAMDLVELQIRIAAGEPLPLSQEDVTLSGWAIEARVCAEDPARGFLPTTGMITRYALPSVKNVRVDSGIEAGSAITIYYDSLLAKVAAWGENREEARLALVRALNGYHIEGLATNVDFVNAIANHPAFVQGDLSTHFIEENGLDDYNNIAPNADHLAHMVIAAVLVYHTRQSLVRQSLKPMSPSVGARSTPKKFHDYVVKADEQVLEVRIEGDRITGWWDVQVDSRRYEVITPEFEYYRRRLFLRINGESHMFRLQWHGQHLKTFFCGIVRVCEIYSPDEWKLTQYMLRRREEPQEKALRCPMPGLVTALNVKEGDYVRKGQEVLRMESMKMESSIESPRDASVAKVFVEVGQAVDTDQELILFEDS
jgi:propionyl-CoA carboxylase alpha chain